MVFLDTNPVIYFGKKNKTPSFRARCDQQHASVSGRSGPISKTSPLFFLLGNDGASADGFVSAEAWLSGNLCPLRFFNSGIPIRTVTTMTTTMMSGARTLVMTCDSRVSHAHSSSDRPDL
jgi:hypothetical protein